MTLQHKFDTTARKIGIFLAVVLSLPLSAKKNAIFLAESLSCLSSGGKKERRKEGKKGKKGRKERKGRKGRRRGRGTWIIFLEK